MPEDPKPQAGPPKPTAQQAQQMGFTGNFCQNTNCGSARMVRAGTCELCLDCQQTSGGCS